MFFKGIIIDIREYSITLLFSEVKRKGGTHLSRIDDAIKLWKIFGVIGTTISLLVMLLMGAAGDIAGAIEHGGNLIANTLLYGTIGFVIGAFIGMILDTIKA